MKIAIVGAGIVGVTTAYELASDGHEVTVFEQRSAAAEEASFATGGLLAPYLLNPWAVPGWGRALRLTGADATLRLAGGLSRTHLGWLWRWRRHARQHSAPATALERLAQYSQGRLNAIAARHELDFESSAGRLVLLRSEPEHAALQPALQLLRDAGVAAHEIDADAARKIEPGLSPEAPLAAAIHLPGAGAGNCRLFAQLLRQGMQGSGVHFAFGTRVDRVSSSPTGVAVQGDADDIVPVSFGRRLITQLKELGVPYEYIEVPGAKHAFGLTPPQKDLRPEVFAFLAKYLGQNLPAENQPD